MHIQEWSPCEHKELCGEACLFSPPKWSSILYYTYKTHPVIFYAVKISLDWSIIHFSLLLFIVTVVFFMCIRYYVTVKPITIILLVYWTTVEKIRHTGILVSSSDGCSTYHVFHFNNLVCRFFEIIGGSVCSRQNVYCFSCCFSFSFRALHGFLCIKSFQTDDKWSCTLYVCTK